MKTLSIKSLKKVIGGLNLQDEMALQYDTGLQFTVIKSGTETEDYYMQLISRIID